MITFLPPPDGVPIDPIAHPYAIENNNKLDNRVDLSRGKPAFRIKESATGNIIAATVCSPIKEERNAEIEIKPELLEDAYKFEDCDLMIAHNGVGNPEGEKIAVLRVGGSDGKVSVTELTQ